VLDQLDSMLCHVARNLRGWGAVGRFRAAKGKHIAAAQPGKERTGPAICRKVGLSTNLRLTVVSY
jgi:hypothetical protein